MSCRFKFSLFQLILLVFVVLLSSIAQAGSSFHHNHDQSDVVSPFNKTNKEKPVHCILNKHQHNIVCPHQSEGGKREQQEFRSDCKPKSGSANSSSASSIKDFSNKLTYASGIPNLFTWEKAVLVYKEQNKLSRSIDHPPRFS